jgi:hypothetical protein
MSNSATPYSIQIESAAETSHRYTADGKAPGLVSEAPTFESTPSLLRDRAPTMLAENNCPDDDTIPPKILTASNLARLRQTYIQPGGTQCVF